MSRDRPSLSSTFTQRAHLMSRPAAHFRRLISCVEIRDGEDLPPKTCGFDDPLPGGIGNSLPPQPPVDRVVLLIQGGGQQAGRPGQFRVPNRKYVVKRLHNYPYLTDYLSVQGRTEKQVTPLFRQLTMLDMKGQRKASTPAMWRKEFIQRVKSARIVSGRKPVEVATELGVNLDTYNRWETRALLPHHMVMPFCRITGADPVMLLTGLPFDLGKAISQTRRA